MILFQPRRRLSLAALALPLCYALAPSTHAEIWPNKPVKIIVPYGPGGAVDVVTRKIAQKLTEQTGQSFFVENKAGATGTIGAQIVAKSEPDGYTLMANDTTYALLPHIFKKLPFDHANDLVPVSAFAFTPMAIAVNSNSKFKTCWSKPKLNPINCLTDRVARVLRLTLPARPWGLQRE
jgi:tripartite-type tricarboxylate transporter receptor subunit TctC